MSLIAMAAPHHPTTFRRDMMWEHGGRGIPELSVRPRQEQQDRVALPSIRQIIPEFEDPHSRPAPPTGSPALGGSGGGSASLQPEYVHSPNSSSSIGSNKRRRVSLDEAQELERTRVRVPRVYISPDGTTRRAEGSAGGMSPNLAPASSAATSGGDGWRPGSRRTSPSFLPDGGRLGPIRSQAPIEIADRPEPRPSLPNLPHAGLERGGAPRDAYHQHQGHVAYSQSGAPGGYYHDGPYAAHHHYPARSQSLSMNAMQQQHPGGPPPPPPPPPPTSAQVHSPLDRGAHSPPPYGRYHQPPPPPSQSQQQQQHAAHLRHGGQQLQQQHPHSHPHHGQHEAVRYHQQQQQQHQHADYMRFSEMPGGLGSLGGDSKQRKRRGNLPKETTERLRSWFVEHLSHPYPTEEEKQDMMRQTGLQMNQISNWFINARRRQLPTLISNARSDSGNAPSGRPSSSGHGHGSPTGSGSSIGNGNSAEGGRSQQHGPHHHHHHHHHGLQGGPKVLPSTEEVGGPDFDDHSPAGSKRGSLPLSDGETSPYAGHGGLESLPTRRRAQT